MADTHGTRKGNSLPKQKFLKEELSKALPEWYWDIKELLERGVPFLGTEIWSGFWNEKSLKDEYTSIIGPYSPIMASDQLVKQVANIHFQMTLSLVFLLAYKRYSEINIQELIEALSRELKLCELCKFFFLFLSHFLLFPFCSLSFQWFLNCDAHNLRGAKCISQWLRPNNGFQKFFPVQIVLSSVALFICQQTPSHKWSRR